MYFYNLIFTLKFKTMNTANKLTLIARESVKQLKTNNNDVHTSDSVDKNSILHFEYIKNKCEELARQGFGSVRVKLDKSYDMFHIEENRGTSYSTERVVELLNSEGFIWKNEVTDYYDAFSDVLIWCVDLPEANNEISMFTNRE